jgi:hypothetical protein
MRKIIKPKPKFQIKKRNPSSFVHETLPSTEECSVKNEYHPYLTIDKRINSFITDNITKMSKIDSELTNSKNYSNIPSNLFEEKTITTDERNRIEEIRGLKGFNVQNKSRNVNSGAGFLSTQNAERNKKAENEEEMKSRNNSNLYSFDSLPVKLEKEKEESPHLYSTNKSAILISSQSQNLHTQPNQTNTQHHHLNNLNLHISKLSHPNLSSLTASHLTTPSEHSIITNFLNQNDKPKTQQLNMAVNEEPKLSKGFQTSIDKFRSKTCDVGTSINKYYFHFDNNNTHIEQFKESPQTIKNNLTKQFERIQKTIDKNIGSGKIKPRNVDCTSHKGSDGEEVTMAQIERLSAYQRMNSVNPLCSDKISTTKDAADSGTKSGGRSECQEVDYTSVRSQFGKELKEISEKGRAENWSNENSLQISSTPNKLQPNHSLITGLNTPISPIQPLSQHNHLHYTQNQHVSNANHSGSSSLAPHTAPNLSSNISHSNRKDKTQRYINKQYKSFILDKDDDALISQNSSSLSFHHSKSFDFPKSCDYHNQETVLSSQPQQNSLNNILLSNQNSKLDAMNNIQASVNSNDMLEIFTRKRGMLASSGEFSKLSKANSSEILFSPLKQTDLELDLNKRSFLGPERKSYDTEFIRRRGVSPLIHPMLINTGNTTSKDRVRSSLDIKSYEFKVGELALFGNLNIKSNSPKKTNQRQSLDSLYNNLFMKVLIGDSNNTYNNQTQNQLSNMNKGLTNMNKLSFIPGRKNPKHQSIVHLNDRTKLRNYFVSKSNDAFIS